MEDVAAYFKALSDETRLRILKLLEEGELCVCDLTAALDMTQPNISFHLGILRGAGLIKDRKDGRWTHYDLDLSDMMSRVVVPTALSRVAGEKVAADRARLDAFMAEKAKPKCCGIR
ncbi:MAG: metalloregulator ArsR/SmtB family transcription factor [Nitrospirae bacterium]|nr:metalloregulator ArsR/SmtB family transcription factor [Nitrospirota bacterium]